MMGRILSALILAQLVAFSAAANSFQKGSDAYSRGDYQSALEEWWPLAASGNAAAQFNLGLMHTLGKGVAQDYAVAAEWCRKAAEQGHAKAQSILGFLYFKGYGVPRDLSKAINWYRKAAEQNYAAAQSSLGTFYLKGVGLTQNYYKAMEWYRKAADQGYAAAQYGLGTMYFSGLGVRMNRSEAAKWYRKAAQQGHANAKRDLRLMAAKTKMAHAEPQPLYPLKMTKETGSSDSSATGFQVQLAAVKMDDSSIAEHKAKRLNQNHASVLGNLQVTPIRAELGERGTFYRFRAGPLADRAAAESLCEKLKARQQACIVVSPPRSRANSQQDEVRHAGKESPVK